MNYQKLTSQITLPNRSNKHLSTQITDCTKLMTSQYYCVIFGIVRKKRLYITLQIGGWLLYVVLAGIANELAGQEINRDRVITLSIVFFTGILTTQLYRYLILKLQWTRFNIVSVIPRILLASTLLAFLFEIMYTIGLWIGLGQPPGADWADHLANSLNWGALFIIWSLMYFAFHFFERYRTEEIKNLRWEAAKNEIELNKLKSQLNPHFIFNSMNSIRALIEEDPEKAKRSVTQLSNILRNTLMMSTQKTVPFDEEMTVVNDYIQLEKTRYEERLRCVSVISAETKRFQVPSLMIQTLVENSIKHGISKLPKGGELSITAEVLNDKLYVSIENPGTYDAKKKSDTGFGLVNTQQRLHLLYGDQASFSIEGTGRNTVVTKIILPLEPN